MWYIFLLVWILSMVTFIITLKINSKDKVIILVSQIYNFMTGFMGWAISFVVSIFVIKFLRVIENGLSFCAVVIENGLSICVVVSGLVILLLLVPLNIKAKKKVKMKTMWYAILSSFFIILGCGVMIALRYDTIKYKLIRSEK